MEFAFAHLKAKQMPLWRLALATSRPYRLAVFCSCNQQTERVNSPPGDGSPHTRLGREKVEPSFDVARCELKAKRQPFGGVMWISQNISICLLFRGGRKCYQLPSPSGVDDGKHAEVSQKTLKKLLDKNGDKSKPAFVRNRIESFRAGGRGRTSHGISLGVDVFESEEDGSG